MLQVFRPLLTRFFLVPSWRTHLYSATRPLRFSGWHHIREVTSTEYLSKSSESFGSKLADWGSSFDTESWHFDVDLGIQQTKRLEDPLNRLIAMRLRGDKKVPSFFFFPFLCWLKPSSNLKVCIYTKCGTQSSRVFFVIQRSLQSSFTWFSSGLRRLLRTSLVG